MYDVLLVVLLIFSVPKLDGSVSIPYRTRFCQPLHAHVQVRFLFWRYSGPSELMPLNQSSLVTGSRSHKLVTSDVSRILWYYYNDSVRGPASFHVSYPHGSIDNSIHILRGQRAILRRALPHEMGSFANRHFVLR